MHVLTPQGFDDPGQPTGGNVYDRRVCAGLAAAGWDVQVTAVAPAWPAADETALASLARVVSALPDGATVLIDGLLASPAAAQLLPHTRRIRLTVLLHMPHGTAAEQAVLRAATSVVTTSDWTRQHVLSRYALPPRQVHVARPGTDPVTAPPRPIPGRLVCVGVLSRHKGQDVLLEALTRLDDRDWQCELIGPLDRDPDFTRQLRSRIKVFCYENRVTLTGVRTGEALSRAYTTADLLVAPSRSETYGMTVTEALAHGVPVAAAEVGGLPEALGTTGDGTRPGLLVPPDDPGSLAAALQDWLASEPLRRRLRAAAAQRRPALQTWYQTTQDVARALATP